MKVFRYIIPALSAALLTTACDNREQMPELRTGEVRECTFSASSEQTTKTYVDGLSVLWEAGDEIAVFDDAGSEKAVLALESGAGTKSATFKGAVSSAATKFFAAYPAASVSAASDSILTVSVPAEQKLVAGGRNLDPAALVGVAATAGTELSFKNVIAAIRFTVDMKNIVSVSLKGNAGEKVAGTVKVDATNGEIVEVADSLTEVTLTPAGETFEPGQYVFTLLPAQFPQGLTLTFTDKEGNATERVNNTDLTIARSRLLDLGAFIKLYDSELSFNPGESKDIRVLSQGVTGLAAENVPDGWKVDAASLADGLLKITAPSAGAAVPAGAFDLKGTSAAGNTVVSDDVVVRFYGINSREEFLEFRSLYQGDDATDNARLNAPVVDPAVIGKYLVDGAVSLNSDLSFTTDDMLLKAYIIKYWNLPLEGNGHTINIDFEGTVSLCAIFQYLGADVRNLNIAGKSVVAYAGESQFASLAAFATNNTLEIKNVSSTVAFSSSTKVGNFGGILAYANQGTLTLDGCSFSGSFDYAPEAVAAAPAFGGLVGRSNTTLTIKNSSVDAAFNIALDNRTLCAAATSGVGGILGVANAEKSVTLENVTNKAVIKVTGVNAGEDRTHFAQIIGNNLAGADLASCTEEGSVTFEDYVGPSVAFAKTELASFKYGDSAKYDFTVENLNGATLVSASVSEAPKGWTVDLAHATETEPYVTVTAPSQDDIKAGTAAGAGEIVIVVKTTRNEEGTNVVKPAVRLYGINSLEEANTFVSLYDKNVKTTAADTRDNEQTEKAAQFVSDYMQDGKIVFNSDIDLGARTNFFMHWVQNPIDGNNRTLTLAISGTGGVVAFCQHLVCPISNLNLAGSVTFKGARTTVCNVASLAGTVRMAMTISNVHSTMTLNYQPNNVSTRDHTPVDKNNKGLNLFVGGIAAMQANNQKVIYDGCSYSGTMNVDYRVKSVGGIVGQGAGSGTYGLADPIDNHGMSTVDGCSFSGVINVNTKVKSVSNYTTVGGLIGEVSRNCKIMNSEVSGKITVDAVSIKNDQAEFAAPVGGLVGRMSNVALLEISDSKTTDSMEIVVKNLHNTAQAVTASNNTFNKIVGNKYEAYLTLNNVTAGGSVKLSWYKDLLEPIEY